MKNEDLQATILDRPLTDREAQEGLKNAIADTIWQLLTQEEKERKEAEKRKNEQEVRISRREETRVERVQSPRFNKD